MFFVDGRHLADEYMENHLYLQSSTPLNFGAWKLACEVWNRYELWQTDRNSAVLFVSVGLSDIYIHLYVYIHICMSVANIWRNSLFWFNHKSDCFGEPINSHFRKYIIKSWYRYWNIALDVQWWACPYLPHVSCYSVKRFELWFAQRTSVQSQLLRNWWVATTGLLIQERSNSPMYACITVLSIVSVTLGVLCCLIT